MAGYFHKVPMELATLSTKLEFPSMWQITHKCYMYRLQQSEQSKRICDYVYGDDVTSSGYTMQQREHTIHEELYIYTF